jgi:uncharacterized damage-inducible protein DinB
MKILDTLAEEFQHEAAITRRALERLPEASFGWKPHEKSMPAARLACHIAEIPGWIVPALDQDELVFDPATFKPWIAAGSAELLAKFDANVAAGLACFTRHEDSVLAGMWSLKSPTETFLTMPKAAVLRGFVLSHLIHHRGQMSVYLRLLNVPVPSIYGPSADEAPM